MVIFGGTCACYEPKTKRIVTFPLLNSHWDKSGQPSRATYQKQYDP
jgi:hypothetical protein